MISLVPQRAVPQPDRSPLPLWERLLHLCGRSPGTRLASYISAAKPGRVLSRVAPEAVGLGSPDTRGGLSRSCVDDAGPCTTSADAVYRVCGPHTRTARGPMTTRQRALLVVFVVALAALALGGWLTLRRSHSPNVTAMERVALNPPGRSARYIDVNCFSIPAGYDLSPNVTRPLDYACSYYDTVGGGWWLTGVSLDGGHIVGGTGSVQLPNTDCLSAPDCLFDRIDAIEPISSSQHVESANDVLS